MRTAVPRTKGDRETTADGASWRHGSPLIAGPGTALDGIPRYPAPPPPADLVDTYERLRTPGPARARDRFAPLLQFAGPRPPRGAREALRACAMGWPDQLASP